MKRIFIFSLLTLITFCAVAQNITLTFTGRDDNSRHMQLNSVVVINHTQGWQETLIWPDTTLTMQKNIGITPIGAKDYSPLRISQNNPNPFNGTTDVMFDDGQGWGCNDGDYRHERACGRDGACTISTGRHAPFPHNHGPYGHIRVNRPSKRQHLVHQDVVQRG